MKVLLVGNYSPDGQISMQLFPRMLAQALESRGVQSEIRVPPVRLGRVVRGRRGAAKWLGYADKFLLAPRDLRRAARGVDVVHICDHSNAMYTRAFAGHPHLVTCHDVLAIRSARGEIPQNPTRWSGRQLQALIVRGLKRAQHVACVSQETRRQLLRLGVVAPDRASVIDSALNYPYRVLDETQARRRVAHLPGLDRPFLLHVGKGSWYKNRAGAVRIFAELLKWPAFANHQLVMAAPAPTTEVAEAAAQCGVADRVREVCGLPTDQIEALYNCADALLFPSWAEGFGWPVLEAMACACPVVTSDRPPMTDIAAEAGIYMDPADPVDAARRIAELWPQRELFGLKGVERARAFATGRMIDRYLELYARLAETGRGSGQGASSVAGLAGHG